MHRFVVFATCPVQFGGSVAVSVGREIHEPFLLCVEILQSLRELCVHAWRVIREREPVHAPTRWSVYLRRILGH